MEIGLHVANFTWPGGPGAIAEQLTRVVTAAEDVGFGRVSVMDHVWQIGPLGPPEEPDARGLHDAGLPGRAHVAGRAAGLGDGRQSTATRACSPRSSPRWTCCRTAGRGSASAPPGTRRSPRASACSSRPPPSASSGWRRRCRSACRCGATTTARTRASTTGSAARSTRRSRCAGRTRRSSSAAAARRRRCGWWRSTPRRATCSPAPTLAHKLDVLRGHCADVGRDYDEIEKTVMVRLDPGRTARRSTSCWRTCAARRPRVHRGARVGAGGGGDHPAGGPRRAGDPGGGEVLRRRRVRAHRDAARAQVARCARRRRGMHGGRVPRTSRPQRPRTPRAGDAPAAAQPIVFWPSIVSRMMSACPACWAVSATMCRNTRRAERRRARREPRAPSAAGATGRGRAATATSASVRAATSLVVGQHAGQGLVGQQPELVRPTPGPAPGSGHSPSGIAIASVPRSMKSAQLGSVAATCLISPPRVSSLAVGAQPGLLVGQAARRCGAGSTGASAGSPGCRPARPWRSRSQCGGGSGGVGLGGALGVRHAANTMTHWCHFLTSIAARLRTWPTRARGRCACCRCCRPTATGRARSWPTGWRCRCGRCAATSTGCASWATRSRRTAAWTAATSSPPVRRCRRSCSTTRRRSRWRSACRPRRRAGWPGSRRRRCARWPRWCR